MSQNNQLLSEGIVTFTGFGTEIHPGEHADRLEKKLGIKESERILQEISKILEEMNQIDPDWSSLSLSEAGSMAKEKMRENHPDLSEDALNALQWTFTWWWK